MIAGRLYPSKQYKTYASSFQCVFEHVPANIFLAIRLQRSETLADGLVIVSSG